MANPLGISLHALGAETVDGSGDAVDIEAGRSGLKLVLTVTAIDGAASFYVDTSPDGSSWRQLGAFDAMSAPGRQKHSFVDCDRYVRIRWDVGTSATFSVVGTAHLVFASPDDIGEGSISEEAIADIDVRVKATGLINASSKAYDILYTSNRVPITAWPESVRQDVADIATLLIMKHRGFNPQTEADALIVKAHDDALANLWKFGKGMVRSPDLQPPSNLGLRVSSGNPDSTDVFRDKFANNWGDF